MTNSPADIQAELKSLWGATSISTLTTASLDSEPTPPTAESQRLFRDACRYFDDITEQLSINAFERFGGIVEEVATPKQDSTEAFDWISTKQRTAYQNHRFAFLDPDETETPCYRCGGIRSFVSVIHNGDSLRRDCGQCGCFLDFPTWRDHQATTKVINDIKSRCSA